MKINSLNILINQASVLNKKFYFISGNEKTLMEKIKMIIVDGFKKKENVQIKNIDTIQSSFFLKKRSCMELNKKIKIVLVKRLP